MTNERIMELAKQAGAYLDGANQRQPLYVISPEQLQRFAELVRNEVLEQPAVEPANDERDAPSNSLPPWRECALRVANSDVVAERVASGGHGADSDVPLASQLHRFIYEYDDANRYRSAWFLHRLELVLREVESIGIRGATALQPQPQQPAVEQASDFIRRDLLIQAAAMAVVLERRGEYKSATRVADKILESESQPQPEVESDAVFYRCANCEYAYEEQAPSSCDCGSHDFQRVEYFTAPPTQKPPVKDSLTTQRLSDGEIKALWPFNRTSYPPYEFARAIEQAVWAKVGVKE